MPELRNLSLEQRRERLSAYIESHYPSLKGMRPILDGHAALAVGDEMMQFSLQFDLPASAGSDREREQAVADRSVAFMGSRYVLPRFGDARESCPPTVVLWACLWTFSMLARYEPVRWAKILNVDSSQDAAGLEEILEDALTVIPWCLLDALGAVPDWSGA